MHFVSYSNMGSKQTNKQTSKQTDKQTNKNWGKNLVLDYVNFSGLMRRSQNC